MRIRTILTFSTGAAMGAAGMYLLDPDSGDERRKDARKQALTSARSTAAAGLTRARRRATDLAASAVSGYQQARAEAGPDQVPGR